MKRNSESSFEIGFGWMEDSPPVEPYQRLILLLAFSSEADGRKFWEQYWPTPGHTAVFGYSDSHPYPLTLLISQVYIEQDIFEFRYISTITDFYILSPSSLHER